MTYSEPRTLVNCTTSMPARSTGRARAGLSRSTTAPHRPGSAGPEGSPGARPARASPTFLPGSTDANFRCLSLRLWHRVAGLDDRRRRTKTRRWASPKASPGRRKDGPCDKSPESRQRQTYGGHCHPPLVTAPAVGGGKLYLASDSVTVADFLAPLRVYSIVIFW